MAKLAFLGLGLIGTPMAIRLLEAGQDLTVWNRTAERTRPLAERGAAVAATPAQAAANVESGRYPPTFKLSLALKDLRLVNEVAERAGRQLGVAAASRAWFERTAVADAGDLDSSAVIATITGDGGAGAS